MDLTVISIKETYTKKSYEYSKPNKKNNGYIMIRISSVEFLLCFVYNMSITITWFNLLYQYY